MVQPNKESHLDEEIKGDEIRDESTYVFHNGHEGKDDPVGEPLSVFGSIGAIDCLEGHVGGIDEGNKVGDEFASTEAVNDGGNDGEAEKEEVDFGVSSLLFNGLQFFILSQGGISLHEDINLLNGGNDLRRKSHFTVCSFRVLGVLDG
mmetsp:Transcript_13753/g.25911  ORF Transcript_13753/g.25911 Transcript_13753/m.25911 type:complete len:148 (+) Transcript_13753:381-824(+)